jgi:iduronate 2-sulfatase
VPNEGPLSLEKRAELRHAYYATTSYLDACVGRMLDTLDETGLADNTIICFWSDHGFELGDHGLWGKLTNYETATRIPLIIAGPELPTAQGTNALVESLDIYPTLTELCELTPPLDLAGQSLAPILEDPTKTVRRAAMSQFHRPVDYSLKQADLQTMGYTIRTDRWRYVAWIDCESGHVQARELYDHASDPIESVNLAGRLEHAEQVETLHELLLATRSVTVAQESPEP